MNISNVNFTSNIAGYEGGAVKWNTHKPYMENVTFKNNSAKIYGDDRAGEARYLVRV